MNLCIIDAHAHCGVQDRMPQTFEDYYRFAAGTGITSVVMFPPVSEIYNRWDPNFRDTPEWEKRRKQANDYILTLKNRELTVIPYFFIWNDFAVHQLRPEHKGIKWHRHAGEPAYHYDDPRCRGALEIIRSRNMPIVLEEELRHTLKFVKDMANGIRIIIPHLGMLNGGFQALEKNGIWKLPNLYADTSLASETDIMTYIQKFGHERLLFGSDFPFGNPGEELDKIRRLTVSDDIKECIMGNNVVSLLADSNNKIT